MYQLMVASSYIREGEEEKEEEERGKKQGAGSREAGATRRQGDKATKQRT